MKTNNNMNAVINTTKAIINKLLKKDNFYEKLWWGYPIHALYNESTQIAKVIDALDKEKEDVVYVLNKEKVVGTFSTRREAWTAYPQDEYLILGVKFS